MPRHYKPGVWSRLSRLLGIGQRQPPATSGSTPATVQAVPAATGVDQLPAMTLESEQALPMPAMTAHQEAGATSIEAPTVAAHPLAREKSRSKSSAIAKLLILESPNRSLVMGLKWQAIVVDQRRNPDAALTLARNAKASWYAPGVSGVVGHGVPDAQAAQRLRRFAGGSKSKATAGERRAQPVSAALLASSQANEGVFALSLPSEDPQGLVWMVLVKSGRPVGQERLVARREALALLAGEFFSAVQSESSAQIWTDLSMPAAPGMRIKPYTIRDLAQLPIQESMYLLPASYRAEVLALWRRTPLLTKLIVLSLMVGMAGSNLADRMWVEPQRLAAQAAQEAVRLEQQAQALSLLSSRRDALLASLVQDLSLTSLRSRLNELPLLVRGWILRSVQCEVASVSSAAAASPSPSSQSAQKSWSCTAAYEIEDRDRFASYAQLMSLLPPWAQFDRAPPQRFSLSFTVQTTGQTVSIDSLPSVEQIDVGFVSDLQRHLRFLRESTDIKFTPMQIEMPRGADGAVIAAPQGFALPQRAALSITAPIAQLDQMLAALPPSPDWRSLRLSVQSHESAEDITLSLTGGLYAK